MALKKGGSRRLEPRLRCQTIGTDQRYLFPAADRFLAFTPCFICVPAPFDPTGFLALALAFLRAWTSLYYDCRMVSPPVPFPVLVARMDSGRWAQALSSNTPSSYSCEMAVGNQASNKSWFGPPSRTVYTFRMTAMVVGPFPQVVGSSEDARSARRIENRLFLGLPFGRYGGSGRARFPKFPFMVSRAKSALLVVMI
ncbi:hypothetical protein DENSPDRAFT_601258 [Dentipellis sp. KUC8613]|nr:hypothetical protein DENSPDRAFT_601258 [Dentipellis sp. KUC8613]